MGCGPSYEQLANRPLDFPLSLPGEAKIIATQSVPVRELGILEVTGRVHLINDINRRVVGWVDAKGCAYSNDYNRTLVGSVDSATRTVYSADYNHSNIGRVDENGNIYFNATSVHQSQANTIVGRIEGPRESYQFAACAFFTLF